MPFCSVRLTSFSFFPSEIQFVIVSGGWQGQTLTKVINSTKSQQGRIILVTQCTADTTATEEREGGGTFPPQYIEVASQMCTISLVIGVMIENDVLKQEENY